ncbi:MAG: hypothetical protein ABIH46_05020 [Chloroflexota bacterium]
MRDAVEFEKRGVPCALIVHDKFGEAARSQARTLGFPDLRIVLIDQPKPGRMDPQDEAEKAEEAIVRVIDALTVAAPKTA